jgi:hypothetical protein
MGTMAGGWRIVKTMGMKITRLKPVGGFCAETAAAISLLGTAMAGIPVSTTHTIAGGIMGVGSVQRFSAVHWGVARSIMWAWVLTIPISGAVSYTCVPRHSPILPRGVNNKSGVRGPESECGDAAAGLPRHLSCRASLDGGGIKPPLRLRAMAEPQEIKSTRKSQWPGCPVARPQKGPRRDPMSLAVSETHGNDAPPGLLTFAFCALPFDLFLRLPGAVFPAPARASIALSKD